MIILKLLLIVKPSHLIVYIFINLFFPIILSTSNSIDTFGDIDLFCEQTGTMLAQDTVAAVKIFWSDRLRFLVIRFVWADGAGEEVANVVESVEIDNDIDVGDPMLVTTTVLVAGKLSIISISVSAVGADGAGKEVDKIEVSEAFENASSVARAANLFFLFHFCLARPTTLRLLWDHFGLPWFCIWSIFKKISNKKLTNNNYEWDIYEKFLKFS